MPARTSRVTVVGGLGGGGLEVDDEEKGAEEVVAAANNKRLASKRAFRRDPHAAAAASKALICAQPLWRRDRDLLAEDLNSQSARARIPARLRAPSKRRIEIEKERVLSSRGRGGGIFSFRKVLLPQPRRHHFRKVRVKAPNATNRTLSRQLRPSLSMNRCLRFRSRGKGVLAACRGA